MESRKARARKTADDIRRLRAVLSDPDAEAPPISSRSLRELASLANKERVLLPLAPWFERAPALDDEAAALISEVRREADNLRVAEDALHEALVQKGVTHTFLKGSALAALDSLPRQRSDVDMMVPDEAAAWATVEQLEAWGYQLDSMSVAAVAPGGAEWAGMVAMEHNSGSWVEISFGDYYPHWFTRLLLPAEFWEWTPTGDGPFPSMRWTAAILVAELVERHRLRLRDERDIANVAKHLSDSDVAWLTSFTSGRGLSAEWAMFERHSRNGRAAHTNGWRDRLRNYSLTATLMIRHDFADVRRRKGSAAAVKAALLSGLRDALTQAVEVGRTGPVIRAASRTLELIDVPVRLQLGGITPLIILTDREPDVDRLQLTPSPPFGRSLVRTPLGYAMAIPVPILSASRYQRLVTAAEALTGTADR